MKEKMCDKQRIVTKKIAYNKFCFLEKQKYMRTKEVTIKLVGPKTFWHNLVVKREEKNVRNKNSYTETNSVTKKIK